MRLMEPLLLLMKYILKNYSKIRKTRKRGKMIFLTLPVWFWLSFTPTIFQLASGPFLTGHMSHFRQAIWAIYLAIFDRPYMAIFGQDVELRESGQRWPSLQGFLDLPEHWRLHFRWEACAFAVYFRILLDFWGHHNCRVWRLHRQDLPRVLILYNPSVHWTYFLLFPDGVYQWYF